MGELTMTDQQKSDLTLIDKACGAYLQCLVHDGHEVAARALQPQIMQAMQRIAEIIGKDQVNDSDNIDR
jgi:hypothetical protein